MIIINVWCQCLCLVQRKNEYVMPETKVHLFVHNMQKVRPQGEKKDMTIAWSSDDQQFQSQTITMDNIWIYVYIFAAAHCFNFVVKCKILVFHRKRILAAINIVLIACGEAIVFYWTKILGCIAVVVSGCRKAFAFCWDILLMKLDAMTGAIRNIWLRRN